MNIEGEIEQDSTRGRGTDVSVVIKDKDMMLSWAYVRSISSILIKSD